MSINRTSIDVSDTDTVFSSSPDRYNEPMGTENKTIYEYGISGYPATVVTRYPVTAVTKHDGHFLYIMDNPEDKRRYYQCRDCDLKLRSIPEANDSTLRKYEWRFYQRAREQRCDQNI